MITDKLGFIHNLGTSDFLGPDGERLSIREFKLFFLLEL